MERCENCCCCSPPATKCFSINVCVFFLLSTDPHVTGGRVLSNLIRKHIRKKETMALLQTERALHTPFHILSRCPKTSDQSCKMLIPDALTDPLQPDLVAER